MHSLTVSLISLAVAATAVAQDGNLLTAVLDQRDRLPAIEIECETRIILDDLRIDGVPDQIGSEFSVRQRSDGENFWRKAGWKGLKSNDVEVFLESGSWGVKGMVAGEADYVEIELSEPDRLWGSGVKDLRLFGLTLDTPLAYTPWDYAMVRRVFSRASQSAANTEQVWTNGPFTFTLDKGRIVSIVQNSGQDVTEALFSEFKDVGSGIEYPMQVRNRVIRDGKVRSESLTRVTMIRAAESHTPGDYELSSLGLPDGKIVASPRGIGIIRDGNFILTHTPSTDGYVPPAVETVAGSVGRSGSSWQLPGLVLVLVGVGVLCWTARHRFVSM